MICPVKILRSALAILFCIVASHSQSQIPGKSILLDGQNDYVEIADHNSLDIAQNLTIEAWINPCSISDYNAIVTKQWCNNSQLSYYFGLRSGYLEWAWDDDGNCSFSSIYRANSNRVPLHKWTHVAVVHSGSGVTLFLDGQQISGGLIQGSHSQIKIGNSPVRIGVYRNQSGIYAEFFDGRIDDVRIWRASLQQSVIFSRKNSALSGSETNLVAYYPMEDSGTGQGVSVVNIASLSTVQDGITIGTLNSPSFVATSVNLDNLFLGNDTTLYIGESILLNAGSSGLQFSWQNGSTDSTFSVSAPGIYWVDAFIGNCKVRDSIVVSYHSQTSPCGLKEASIYGEPELDERGYCLVATPQKDGIYVAGTKNDSTLLVRFDLGGNVIWSKTFDIIPNVKETPASILLDSEGMLAVAGTALINAGNGAAYVFRYNPLNHTVLWSKRYKHSEADYASSIIQKGPGGNYILANSLSYPIENHNDAEIFEIEKNTGAINTAFVKNFTLWGTEGISEIVYDGNFIYTTGRYKDKGPFTLEMRNTISKLDPASGNQVWVRMGHKQPNQSARLYGAHLVVDGDKIISGYHGDPNGQSTSNTKVFFQLTDLAGIYRWIRQYEIPGANDLCLAVTKSGNGYVFLLGQRASPSGLYLVKIDAAGNVQWAKKIVLADFIVEVDGIGGNLKLIEVGDQLILTANGINASGKSDLLLIRTDLNGESNIPCVSTEDIQITPVDVADPEFYEVTPDQFSVTINVSQAGTLPVDNTLLPREECAPSDTIFTDEEAIICYGLSYEGYSVTGVYADTYTTSNGCDSIRTLVLTVLPPVGSFFFQTICEGEEFMGYATGGIHLDTFKTLEGCDSVRTVQLSVISCEPDCGVIMGSIYGDPDLNETADCLAATPQNDGMYVAGIRNQHVILMRLNLKGVVSWSKVFDVVQNKPEFVNCIMVDSDGNILLSGIAGPAQISQGGTPFALKYDPFTHQVLWSKEFTTHSRNYNNSIIQKGPGGNYMLSNNPHLGFTDDEEIIELNINTGDPVASNTRNYRLMGSESVNLLYHEGFIYGVGRYTSNAATEFMRHTIVKIDPDDGSQLWVKMGHIGPDDYARLYGVQMVIDEDEIYSCYFGDPNGTSLSTTKMFVQKTSTSGTLRWVKQYDLPGGNDAVYAIAKSGNGLVLLAGQYNNSLGLNLFKIDTDGNIAWSKKIDFDTYVNATPGGKAISKLIEVGNILAFTSISRNASGEDDMLIGRTDLNGESDIPCLTTQDVSISVINISNPQFYSVTPTLTNSSSQSKSASPNVADADIEGKVECVITDTLYSTIVHTMCTGEVFEGYTDSGTYVDHFTSNAGCDSIRTLILDIELPSSFLVVSFCEGSSFENYDQGGFYIDTIPGIIGCDTVRHLTLIETPAIQTILDVTICSGTGYLGYDSDGIYLDTFQTAEGCDSIRILHLSVTSEITTIKDVHICLGDVHDGYFQDGIYLDTLQSIFGCDSIIQLHLTVIPEEKFITVEVCEGVSFEQYSLPGQYIDTIQGGTSACDTIRHITLEVLPAEKTNISYTICAEDHFNGHTEPGEYSDTLIAVDGCITIQTVLLSVRDPITSYAEVSLCDGSVQGHHGPGIIIDTLISSLGCDSIRTLSIEGPAKYIPNAFSPNHDGNNDLFEIFAPSGTNIDLDYFAIFDRFGDMTYETAAWPVLWDGNRRSGQPHPSGVYAYILIYQCGDERFIEHGNITLVK